jgi:lambda repressor-like predicted transcriptional regulator
MALPIHQHKHIAAWQSSGLSQVAYCRQHQLNSKTFANWLRAYRTQSVAAVASTVSVQRHHLTIFNALNYPQTFFERITNGITDTSA